jgi:rhodanese-related sulfurtransferase
LTATEVAAALSEGRIVLVDVREPHEIALERIPGALPMPMSQFDPGELPNEDGRPVVFSCASGMRSVAASQIAQASGLPFDAHLAGGIKAWKAAGLPTET